MATEPRPAVEYCYTLAFSQREAELLARGIVPKEIQDTVISLLIDVQASPADALANMTRRRRNGGKPS